jgi:hypothetical protein
MSCGSGGPMAHPFLISLATVIPVAEWIMTRTFSDPTMTTKGFYRVKTPPE